MDEPWVRWRERWEEAAAACSAGGGVVQSMVIEPPATEEEITAVESTLERALPAALRRVLTGFSRRVDLRWQLPIRVRAQGLENTTRGECMWSIDDLPRAEEQRRAWVTDCFTDRDDPYGAVWHDKLGALSLINGDVVAIDQRPTEDPVIYLSHEYGPGHGKRMGADFIAFIDEHSRVACVGLEDWQWMPFYRAGFGIDSRGERATAFRERLGLRVA